MSCWAPPFLTAVYADLVPSDAVKNHQELRRTDDARSLNLLRSPAACLIATPERARASVNQSRDSVASPVTPSTLGYVDLLGSSMHIPTSSLWVAVIRVLQRAIAFRDVLNDDPRDLPRPTDKPMQARSHAAANAPS